MPNFQLQVGQQNSRSNKETENLNNSIDQLSTHRNNIVSDNGASLVAQW